MNEKFLVIVESGTKAKTIAKYLGTDYLVKPTVGHIMDLPPRSLGINIADGFRLSTCTINGKEEIVKAIKEASKHCSKIFIASDLDREGEAIASNVYSILDKDREIKRVEFKEITKKSIIEAINNGRDIDNNMVDAQKARRAFDRLVGFFVSPYVINRIGKEFGRASAGRVQSVALRMIVEREREIEKFIPDNYYTISANLMADGGGFIAEYPEKLKSKENADDIRKKLEKREFVVSKVDAKPQNRNPYSPFNTADMMVAASSKLKFLSDKTMKIAQALYEGGYISYIRTDSYRNSDESIESVREFIKSNGMDVPSVPNTYKSKEDIQDAHEAIRPTNVGLVPDDFVGSEDNSKLYKLIWDRFVASQMKAAVYDTVAVDIAAGDITLKASGRTLKYKGWLEIYEDDKKDKDAKLPILVKGNVLKLIKVKTNPHTTKAPPRFSDGAIILELKKRGIGRPATLAPILTKIEDKGFVSRNGGFLIPTDSGKRIVDELCGHFKFMEYDFTKRMEDIIDDISVGKESYKNSVEKFYNQVVRELFVVNGLSGIQSKFNCPDCGSATLIRSSIHGYFAACEKWKEGCSGKISLEISNGDLVEGRKKIDITCDCGLKMNRIIGKLGPFAGCTCGRTRSIPTGIKCEKCGKDTKLAIFGINLWLKCFDYDCNHTMEMPEGFDPGWEVPLKVIEPSPKNAAILAGNLRK